MQNLPKELTTHVSWSVAILGNAIKAVYGDQSFKIIEELRVKMKESRQEDFDGKFKILSKSYDLIKGLSNKELENVAHAYLLMLETMNRCENAYRIFKIKQREEKDYDKLPSSITYVFTAHPTEARSKSFMTLFGHIQSILEDSILHRNTYYERKLFHFFVLALKVSPAPGRKPTVEDEAENIYSYVLNKKILQESVLLRSKNISLRFRTWVGGDKDGHPGVDEKVFKNSLTISRGKFIEFINELFNDAKRFLKLIDDQQSYLHFRRKIYLLKFQVKRLRKLKRKDFYRVEKFKNNLAEVSKEIQEYLNEKCLEIEIIENIFKMFPALVLPLEIREDAEVVAEAINKPKGHAIGRMLIALNSLADKEHLRYYARGFILSMTMDAKDITNGITLLSKTIDGYHIPVIPLFENHKGLTESPNILKGSITEEIRKAHQKKWKSRYEVMLGYSDSSKENGVFPSRVLISQGMKIIDKTLSDLELTPIFFHGSGGSIERGGGSVSEQTQFWPDSALDNFKVTVQGEMVARIMGSPFILKSHTFNIVDQFSQEKRIFDFKKYDSLFDKFSNEVSNKYKSLIEEDYFWDIVAKSTPYHYLSDLKIGSRPSKRSTGERKLRAIPWILCWTQTRLLFPTWWGAGSAWFNLTQEEKDLMLESFNANPLMSSYVKQLGFTLKKVELSMWKLYLHSFFEKDEAEKYFRIFEEEFQKTMEFFLSITGNKELLWFRPWLGESVSLRTSMIHPLNLIQIEAMKRQDIELLRTSVTGISCGMMTTG
jgi:phosphoenolpyruvate carboxylase